MTSRRPTLQLVVVATGLLVVSCSISGTAQPAPGNDAALDTRPAPDATDTTGGTDETSTTEPTESSDPAYGVEPAEWAPCTDNNLDCATIEVPLDHDDPGGERIGISMVRVPASGERRGSIFVNPGGPGGSGIEFVTGGFRLDPETMAAYDLVGFDPRGVGSSSPLNCTADRTQGPLPDLSPDDPAEASELDDHASQIAADCAASDADLLEHLGTDAVARDLDLLRQAVGDEQLHYYGFSYGTLIGLVYADAFGERVGHLVLDGVVDPASSLGDLLGQQAVGFDAAFAELDAACDELPGCPDGGIAAAYDRTLAAVEASGPVGEVGPAEIELAALGALYSEGLWPLFTSAVAAADGGDLSAIESLSDLLIGSVSTTAYLAVTCSDLAYPDVVPPEGGPEAWDAFADDLTATSARFGATLANEVRPCAHWPTGPAEPRDPVEAQTAAPVLVIGTTGDPATLLANAETVASTLGDARLVIHDGNGHTAYRSSACVQRLVHDYFADDRVPSTTTDC